MKTKSLVIPVSPEVAGFAIAMETKLQMEGYDQIEAWNGIPIEKLMAQLKVKAERLAAADPTQHGLFMKAVVVANLAMMIAEKTAQLRVSEASSVEGVVSTETVITFPGLSDVAQAEQKGMGIGQECAALLPQ